MEDSVEIVIEKLLHVTKDVVQKVCLFISSVSTPIICVLRFFSSCFQVSSEAEHCLSIVLSQYDPFRCLSVRDLLKHAYMLEDFDGV